MIKIIDVDALFEKYISDFVYKNVGKVNPEEIEDKIPVLYNEFGDKKCDALDGKSPNEYYKSFPATELLACLKEHIKKGVSVSDFLCEALESTPDEDAILSALGEEESEEFILYLMNILSARGSKKAYQRYLDFIAWDYSAPVKELAAELLIDGVEDVKDRIISEFKNLSAENKLYLTEVLSHAKKDDRVFEILINEFLSHGENIPLYASFLVRFGDEKALPFLTTAIENEKIDYADFEELRFSIEALGGIYDKERDFNNDKVRKKLKDADVKR